MNLFDLQQYYNITSDMMTEEMLLIANENLQTCIEIEAEEKELKSLINPLHIWLNRWEGEKETTESEKL